MGKQVTIKIYSPHDLDLCSFIATHEFDITKAIYCSLSAFSKGEAFVTMLPPLKPAEKIHKKVIIRNLILDEKKDKAIIELLEKITPGYRNCFIKNVLRLYLAAPFTEEFFTDPDDYSDMMDKLQSIRQGRRITRAADPRRKKINHVRRNKKQAQNKNEAKNETPALDSSETTIDSNLKETAEPVSPPQKEMAQDTSKIEKANENENNESFSDVTNILFRMLGQ